MWKRPKTTYRFIQIPIFIPMTFFAEIKKNLKIHMKLNRTPHCSNILEKKKAGQHTFPDFKTYDKATEIKILWY